MPKRDVNIRSATAADSTDIAACVQRAYEGYIGRIGKPPGPMLDDYSRVIAEHAVYVADLDGVVVGVLVLIYEHGQVLMDNVAVSPDHQGQGIGGVLIRYAEQTVESQGYKGIELYTHQRMTENIAMYRSRGYTETERRIEKGYERVYMRKIF